MSQIAKNDMILEKLVRVNRVTKVCTGGRTISFSAIVVVGNEKGLIGADKGKAKEVSNARMKAIENAKRKMISVDLYEGRTIYHDVRGHFGAAKVLLRKAPPGTGVIAGGALRAVFDLLGIKDIVAKSFGSTNPQSMISAAMNALENLNSFKDIASRRGKSVSELEKHCSV